MPRNLANELISREDFPANIETLATTMGAIFNYYGRRSICKMYATDYIDEADTSVIAGFIGEDTVKALDAFICVLGLEFSINIFKVSEIPMCVLY